MIVALVSRLVGRACLLTISAMIAAALVGCSPPDPVSGVGSLEVQKGQSATLTSTDGQIVVTLAEGSVSGRGDLRIVEAVASSGVRGWLVELEGAELSGTATIRFRRENVADDAPVPIVLSAAGPNDELTVVDAVEIDEGDAVVVTDHFSFWTVEWWEDLLERAREGMDRIYSGSAEGKQPRCTQEQNVRDEGFTVSSDDGTRVKWCFGRDEADDPMLSVVNTRGYTVAVEFTPNLAVRDRGIDELITAVASIISQQPSRPGNAVTLLSPGGRLDLTLTGGGQAGVRVKPSVPGYLVTAAQYGIDTLAMVLEPTGNSRSRQALIRALEIEICLAGFSSMATYDIQNASEAGNYLNDALSTVLGCLRRAIDMLDLGFVGTAIVTGVTWLITGLRTALNGLGAAADTALNPSAYTITIDPPAPTAADTHVPTEADWWHLNDLCRGSSGEEALAACSKRDALTEELAHTVANEFVEAWARKDSEQLESLVSSDFPDWQMDSIFALTLQGDPDLLCRYDSSKPTMYCYVHVVEHTAGMGFQLDLDEPAPGQDLRWFVSGIAPDV